MNALHSHTLYHKAKMRIIRAEHLGMCFGVRDAIALARKHAEAEPLTILGDLVHNETVLSELRARGITIEQRAEEATTETVMVTAHGTSHRALAQTRALGLNVIEATCPLVHAAHRAVAKLAHEGFHPIIIGKHDHVEVRGLTGDLDEFDVVLCEMDLWRVKRRERFGVVAQTTQPIEKVRFLVNALRRHFPDSEVRFVDTVCRPTKERQHAAVELAQRSDAVVVIGGANSNNTHELVKTCKRHCARVHHVQSADGLQPEWFLDCETVGITAGTSTPDKTIDEVERWLQQFSEVEYSVSENAAAQPAERR